MVQVNHEDQYPRHHHCQLRLSLWKPLAGLERVADSQVALCCHDDHHDDVGMDGKEEEEVYQSAGTSRQDLVTYNQKRGESKHFDFQPFKILDFTTF